MPFILLLIGAILFVAGVRGTNKTLWALVKGDFTGSNSFLVWVAAIAVVGGVGYIPKLRPISVAFMTLLLIVLFLSNKGVITQLQSFVQNPVATPPNDNASSASSSSGLAPLQPLAPLLSSGGADHLSFSIPGLGG